MKRFVILFIIINLFTVISSCCNNNKVYNHNFGYILIDEDSHFNDKYYSKIISQSENNYLYSIYKKDTNEFIDQISLITYKSCLCIYDDVIYVLYEYNDKIYYYFKELGKTQGFNNNINYINDINFSGIISMNDKSFFIKSYYHMTIVDQDYNQSMAFYGKPKYFFSLNDNSIFSFDILNESNKIEIKNINSNEVYYYNFSNEIIDAKYNYKTNQAFWNFPKWNEQDSLYFKNEYVFCHEDDCIYFAYSKYLGEFNDKKHYCIAPSSCLFSNCKTEILKFNYKEKSIKSVGILPDGYRVLKIMKNSAIIIKNTEISEYNFSTANITFLQEVDWTEYYELNNDLVYELKIYLIDNRIVELGSYYHKDSVCYNFECYES